MINRDYILRMAEMLGRELAIVLRLRKRDRQEEALIAIDNLLLKQAGLTSRFINSLSEEMAVQVLSPLGKLNVENALWIAMLLKVEGDIYEEQCKTSESYYRYVKALYLLLEVSIQEHLPEQSDFYQTLQELLHLLQNFEISPALQLQLFRYYEQIGLYAKAENILFELLEESRTDRTALIQRGREFYQRLAQKSEPDLQAGDFSHEEVAEGQKQIQTMS